jgi:hypothetical protein
MSKLWVQKIARLATGDGQMTYVTATYHQNDALSELQLKCCPILIILIGGRQLLYKTGKARDSSVLIRPIIWGSAQAIANKASGNVQKNLLYLADLRP